MSEESELLKEILAELKEHGTKLNAIEFHLEQNG